MTPLAILHCERGEFGAAARALARALDSLGLEAVEAAQSLDLLVGCHLSLGDLSAAQEAVERLEALAQDAGNRVRAHLAFARGRVALASQTPDRSAESVLELAMQLFADCNLPYETAQVRITLARALADQPEVAVAEAQGALSTFERLGAARDADAAASFVRTLGGKARTGPKDMGVLTPTGAGSSAAGRLRPFQSRDCPAAVHQPQDGLAPRKQPPHQTRAAQPGRGGNLRRQEVVLSA